MSAVVEFSVGKEQYSRKSKIWECGPDGFDKLLPDAVLEIVLLILVPLGDAGVSANGADVDHAIPELDECAPLLGNLEVGNVVQDELDELLVRLLAQPSDEAVRGKGHAHAIGRETVLGEAEVEERGHGYGGSAELLLLLYKVGAAHETDGDLVPEAGEEFEHLGGDSLGRSQLSITI